MTWMYFIAYALASFVLGSVSFAWLAGKLHGKNLHEHGSGNLGATNAGRVLGTQWFFLVFLGDVSKGLIPVLLAQHYGATFLEQTLAYELLPCVAGVACILGHSFTIFHGFKGGKAVATSLGVTCALIWMTAAITAGVWFIAWLLLAAIFKLKRSDAVGPASVIAAVALSSVYFTRTTDAFSMPHVPVSLMVCMISTLFIVRHRSNIKKFFAHIRTTDT